MKRRYDLLYGLGAMLSSPVLTVGLLRSGKWRTDWPGRLGRLPSLPDDPRPTLLLHGVSVGEINATRMLVRRLTRSGSLPVRIVVSATTDTGFARAQELYGRDHHVVRFPFDFSWMVRRFLEAVRPDLVALMELEVWPNLAQECHRRGIPLTVINGRLSDGSFRKYRWARPWVRPVFQGLTAVAAQTEEYARRFRALGTPGDRVEVTDTMKWDTVTLEDQVEGAEELGRAMGIDPRKPLVVAGSTGPGEEELLLKARSPEVQLMLVPRKPERFDEVAGLDPGMVRRSGGGASGGPSSVFLLDTMGELTKAYCLADVAVVGRSFVPHGGSDPIEAVALGKPAVVGPHHDNFRDVVAAFQEARGIRVTDRPMEAVRELLASPEEGRAMAERGRGVIRARQGATERHAELLLHLLGTGKSPQVSSDGPGRRGRIVRWGVWILVAYLLLGYLTTAIHIVPAQRAPPGAPILPLPSSAQLTGVFSVHTQRSHDARGTRAQLARAARDAGLDFVVIGDHPPDDRRPDWELWGPEFREGVLVVGGQELRAPEAGKILAMAVDTTYKQWKGDYEAFRNLLERERATSFVVHGRGPRGSERWVHSTTEGIQGWEVLDMSEFARHRLTGLWGPYHLMLFLVGLPLGLGDEALLHTMRDGFSTPAVAAYDSLRLRGPLTATAGLNHHPKMQIGPWLLPPYEPFFRSLRNHLLVETATPVDPESARDFLAREARDGGLFITVGDDAGARWLSLTIGAAGMGEEVPFRAGDLLRAGFSGEGREEVGRVVYRIMRNGEEVTWTLGPDLDWEPPSPGFYRVEVYRYSARVGSLFFRLRPWIFTNPVGLRGPGDGSGDG
jgi:3-deoxy-D-manno-octulosonic-acid transferase